MNPNPSTSRYELRSRSRQSIISPSDESIVSSTIQEEVNESPDRDSDYSNTPSTATVDEQLAVIGETSKLRLSKTALITLRRVNSFACDTQKFFEEMQKVATEELKMPDANPEEILREIREMGDTIIKHVEDLTKKAMDCQQRNVEAILKDHRFDIARCIRNKGNSNDGNNRPGPSSGDDAAADDNFNRPESASKNDNEESPLTSKVTNKKHETALIKSSIARTSKASGSGTSNEALVNENVEKNDENEETNKEVSKENEKVADDATVESSIDVNTKVPKMSRFTNFFFYSPEEEEEQKKFFTMKDIPWLILIYLGMLFSPALDVNLILLPIIDGVIEYCHYFTDLISEYIIN